MADLGVVVLSPLPPYEEVTDYLAPVSGTFLGPVVFRPPDVIPTEPPTEGQLWPRGDYNPT